MLKRLSALLTLVICISFLTQPVLAKDSAAHGMYRVQDLNKQTAKQLLGQPEFSEDVEDGYVLWAYVPFKDYQIYILFNDKDEAAFIAYVAADANAQLAAACKEIGLVTSDGITLGTAENVLLDKLGKPADKTEFSDEDGFMSLVPGPCTALDYNGQAFIMRNKTVHAIFNYNPDDKVFDE